MRELARPADIPTEVPVDTTYRIKPEYKSSAVETTAQDPQRELPGQHASTSLSRNTRRVAHSTEGAQVSHQRATTQTPHDGAVTTTGNPNEQSTVATKEDASAGSDGRKVAKLEGPEAKATSPKPAIDRNSDDYKDTLKAFYKWGDAERERLEKANPSLSQKEIHFKWLGEMQRHADELNLGLLICD